MQTNELRYRLAVLGLLVLGLLLRLTDLSDPPLDYNPSRQLRSALIARGMFYENLPGVDPEAREFALAQWKLMVELEPTVIERIASWGYRLAGQETIAVPRVLNSIAWIIGGLALAAWARRHVGRKGVLAAWAYFLFLPFAVYASRSFQPDPAMVALAIAAGYSLDRWVVAQDWKWALLAGFLGGMSILLKSVTIFLICGMLLGALAALEWHPRRILRSPHVYAIAGLLVLPLAVYMLTQLDQKATGDMFQRTVFYNLEDVLSPSFYMRWLIRVDGLMHLPLIGLGLVGTWFYPQAARRILIGLWLGYAVYVIFFPYHILTHDYYNLPLVFVTALGLAGAGQRLADPVWEKGLPGRLVLALLGVLAIAYPGWIARSVILGNNYADAPAYWELVGREIPPQGRAVGYTQDYGFRLAYYGWRRVDVLPELIDPEEFAQKYAGAHYFVITAKNMLSPALDAYLSESYPVHAQGGGYLVYDLQP